MGILTEKTFIIGSGQCARNIADELLARGREVIIFAKQDIPSVGKTEIFSGAELLSCGGKVGNFEILLSRNGERFSRTVSDIVIAEDAVKKANFSLYGLRPSSRVISLSRLRDFLSDSANYPLNFSSVKKAVFLTGLPAESHPVILEDIMQSCLRLQSDFQIQTYVLTKNLKVAGKGLEALYRKTREAGAVYIKFTETLPEIREEKDAGVTIVFFDEVTGQKFSLRPDITVSDEIICPSDDLGAIAALFGLDRDRNGFIQSDNVHRLSVQTNRKGIFSAGGSRNIQSDDELLGDVGNAVISVLRPDAELSENKPEINSGRCARCLTCYRSCPYRAIEVCENGVHIMTQACERCGICAAECPGRAITIKGLAGDYISRQIAEGIPTKQEKFIPYLAAFCCGRSAAPARELALGMKYPLPRGLKIIEVPCAGAISYEHIFSAITHADGVLILTCHEGNCHSEYGNVYARKRAGRIMQMLSATGFEPERLLTKTLASNMGKEFAEIAGDFEKRIIAAGPNGLKN